MKSKKLVLIILCLAKMANLSANEPSEAVSQQPAANHAIMLFIRSADTKKVVTNVSLQASYGGYIVGSNHNGQIILPRKTEGSEFYLVVTPTVNPNIQILNNVAHLEIPAQNNVAIYHLILEKNDWIVTQAELPENRYVPLQAIIILTEPENVDMPLGKTPSLLSNHLILPSIYINNPLDDQNSLSIPDSRPFLANLKTAYALTPYGYATIQVP